MRIESEIRTLLQERTRSIHDKDAVATLRYYSSDIVNFDVAPPLAQKGREATEPAALQEWFDTWDGPINLTFDQLNIHAAGPLAFAHAFLHMHGKRTDGLVTDVWLRFTACLEQRAGQWMIVHEHQSFPTMMDGSGLSASDLRP